MDVKVAPLPEDIPRTMQLHQSESAFVGGVARKSKENCFNESEKEFLAKTTIQILQDSPMAREGHPERKAKPSLPTATIAPNQQKELKQYAKSTLHSLDKRCEYLKSIQTQVKTLQTHLKSQFSTLSACQTHSQSLSSTMNTAKQDFDLQKTHLTLQQIAVQSKDDNLIYNVPKVEELVKLFVHLTATTSIAEDTLQFQQARKQLCSLVFKLAVKTFEAAARGTSFSSAFDSAFILRQASAAELHKRTEQLAQLACTKETSNALVQRYFAARKAHLTQFASGTQQASEFSQLIAWIHKLWQEEMHTFHTLFPTATAKEGDFSRFFYEAAVVAVAPALETSISRSQSTANPITVSTICKVLFDQIALITSATEDSSSTSSATFFKRALIVTIAESLLAQVEVLWNQFTRTTNSELLLDEGLKFIQIYQFFDLKERVKIAINFVLGFIVLEQGQKNWTLDDKIALLTRAVQLIRALGVKPNSEVQIPLPPSNKIVTLALENVVPQVQYTENHTVDL